jgi:inositol oxygenase
MCMFFIWLSQKCDETVVTHYREMRKNQTVDFVRRMNEKYSFKDGAYRAKFSIRKAFEILEGYVDSSDPDISLPNLVHMMQTAEGIRRAGHPDWMQLTGLIHDMGKILFYLSNGNEEDGMGGTGKSIQWALGGDTWVVGRKIPDTCIFPEFNSANPDMTVDAYNTDLGIYQAGCGMNSLLFAYGHDEYLYQMLKANGCTIPEEAFAMIRFHSCYPWHTRGEYREFMTEQDYRALEAVRTFNQFDLYTKDNDGAKINVEELWPYYDSLIEKYFPSQELKW